MLADIRFSDPGNLPLAAIACLLTVICGGLVLKNFGRARRLYGAPHLVDTYSTRVGVVTKTMSLFAFIAPVLLIGVAIIGPYLPGAQIRVPVGKEDVVVGIQDTRGMETTDYLGLSEPDKLQFFHGKGSDLDAASYMVRHYISPAMRGQLAVLVFQGEALSLVDLTDSLDMVDKTLRQSLKIGMASVGTVQKNGKVSSIAAFLEAALDECDRYGEKGHDCVIVYMGKGDDTSDPERLAKVEQRVRERASKIIIIGLGGEPTRIPVYADDANASTNALCMEAQAIGHADDPNCATEQLVGYYSFKDGTEPTSGIDEAGLKKLEAELGPKAHYICFDPKNLPKIDWSQELSDWKTVVGKDLLFSWPAGAAYLIIVLMGLISCLEVPWKEVQSSRLFHQKMRR